MTSQLSSQSFKLVSVPVKLSDSSNSLYDFPSIDWTQEKSYTVEVLRVKRIIPSGIASHLKPDLLVLALSNCFHYHYQNSVCCRQLWRWKINSDSKTFNNKTELTSKLRSFWFSLQLRCTAFAGDKNIHSFVTFFKVSVFMEWKKNGSKTSRFKMANGK